MQIMLNGDAHEVSEGTTVAALIAQVQLRQRRYAIEVNQEIVRRDLYEQHVLRAGDHVEIITFVGGG